MSILWLLCPYGLFLYVVVIELLVPLQSQFTPEWSDMYLLMYSAFLSLIFIPLNPLAFVIALNIGLGLMGLPMLFRMFTGVDTVFTLNPGILANSTFLVAVCTFTYCCLDPIAKAAYALRAFQLESTTTATDLLVRIRRIVAAALVSCCLLLPTASVAQEISSQSPAIELDQQLNEVLEEPRYAWQLPRQRPESEPPFLSSIADGFSDFMTRVKDFFKRIQDWSRRSFSNDPGSSSGGIGRPSGTVLKLSATALLVALAVLLFILVWRGRRRGPVQLESTAVAAPEMPDLEDEETTADALPEDEWLQMAERLLADGNVRLAMRALFFSTLSALGHKRLVSIARHKSNRDYLRELRRTSHAAPNLEPLFALQLNTFESVWYGDHPISRERLSEYRRSMQEVRNHAT